MRSYLCWFGICAFCALMIYDVKYNVHNAQKETRALERQLMQERERLHMAELEWTHLSRPDRIAALAQKHLSLQLVGQGAHHTQNVALWKISTLNAWATSKSKHEGAAQ